MMMVALAATTALLLCMLVSSLSADAANVGVIGAGFAGLTAACELSRLGHKVTVYDRRDDVGGRANRFSAAGFTFDAGPSWYWMPELFDGVFARFGHRRDRFYNVTRLDPAYRVWFGPDDMVDVPGSSQDFLEMIHHRDPHASLDDLMDGHAKIKYERGVFSWIWRPMHSLINLLDPEMAIAALSMNMLSQSVEEEIHSAVHDARAQILLSWPVIFIGDSPSRAPAVYTLMTYAGHMLGTFYPDKGMSTPAESLATIARDSGVQFRMQAEVISIEEHSICVADAEACDKVDGIVAAADYYHVEQSLLPERLRRYDEHFWSGQIMSPACLLFYLGFDDGVSFSDLLAHHTFFFDDQLDQHLRAVFETHEHFAKPTFYVSASSSAINPTSAPLGSTALFVLVPMSYHFNTLDTPEIRERLLQHVLTRLDMTTEAPLRPSLRFRRTYGPSEFSVDFHAFRGNAFGHANTLDQSLAFKPMMQSLADSIVFAGHMTHPGPGIPPTMISGIVAAGVLHDNLLRKSEAATSISKIAAWVLSLLAFVHVMVMILIMRSPVARSYLHCVRLLYVHGKTFFAGATMLSPRCFLDTAALYGLFRAADDIVDVDQNEDAFGRFESQFWSSWKSGRVTDPSAHPVLPAVIEVISDKKKRYKRSQFERFFAAVRSDFSSHVVCQTFTDTLEYSDGSAGVIGEFMVPILISDDQEKQERAMEGARALGFAFQFTNMIRDVEEDARLGRQYLPQDVFAKHGLSLEKLQARPDQSGFGDVVEDVFAEADVFYSKAESGIELLPCESRDAIRVAATLYHSIHDEIRAEGYRVFGRQQRVHLSLSKKLWNAYALLPLSKMLRILAVELYTGIVFSAFLELGIPLLVIIMAVLMTSFIDELPNCTYAFFHVLFTLPPLAVLAIAAKSRHSLAYLRKAGLWIAALCVVALIYTTPWDNYLVYRKVWSYGEARVLSTIGFVPIEEYAFFVIETLLVSGIWLSIFPSDSAHYALSRPVEDAPSSRIIGITFFMVLSLAGSIFINACERTLYMGLVLAWSMPVLTLQWWVGCEVLIRHWRRVCSCIIMSTAFLSILDAWAIERRIWLIQSRYSLPLLINGRLPVEEMLFFLVTSSMCAFGLTLAMAIPALLPRRPTLRQFHSSFANAIGFAAVLVFGLAKTRPSLEVQMKVFLVVSAVLGMPHGALDVMMIRSYISYLGWMGFTLILWLVAPVLAFSMFVILSVFHFGEGDVQQSHSFSSIVEIVARGGAFLSTAKYFEEDTLKLVTFLVGSSEGAAIVVAMLKILVVVQRIALFGTIVLHRQPAFDAATFLEMLVVNLLFAFTPSLIAFGIYFNVYHSLRHMIRFAEFAPIAARRTALATGAAVVPMVAIAMSMATPNSWMEDSIWVAVVGVSMLTTPHLLLLLDTLLHYPQHN